MRYVISFKKNGGVINKIYCLILRFSIYASLLLVSAAVKMPSTSSAIVYNSIESRHPWQTHHIRVKRSNRKLFQIIETVCSNDLFLIVVLPTINDRRQNSSKDL